MTKLGEQADQFRAEEATMTRSVVDLRKCHWQPPQPDNVANGHGEGVTILDVPTEEATPTIKRFYLSDLALKQAINRIASGLYTTISKSPTHLQQQILDVWLPMTEEKNCLVTLKHTKETNFVKGILGLEQSDLDMSTIIAAMDKAINGQSYELYHISPDEDYTYKAMRILLKEFPISPKGDPHKLMVDLRASPYGVNNLELELGVWRQACENGALARVAGQPYFKSGYKGIQGADLEAAFASAISRSAEHAKAFSDQLERSLERSVTEEGLQNLIKTLPRDRETSKSIMLKVAATIEEKKPQNMFAVADIITEIARDADLLQHRIRHEAYGGYLLGLEYVQSKAA